MQIKRQLAIAVIAGLLFANPVTADVRVDPVDGRSNERIESVLDAPGLSGSSPVVAKYWETGRGIVFHPDIKQSSGDRFTDFDCLEAICSISPVNGAGFKICINRAKVATFTSTRSHSASGKEKLRTSGKVKSEQYLIYLIPRGIVFNYPSLFTPTELASDGNLRIINTAHDTRSSPFDYAKTVLWKVTDDWSDFLWRNPKPSKQSIIEHARKIQSNLGLERLR